MLSAKLKEGQQVAVIRVHDTNTATVDLYVSILDQTGSPYHNLFCPIGIKPNGFNVNEEDSLTFANMQTVKSGPDYFQGYQQTGNSSQFIWWSFTDQ